MTPAERAAVVGPAPTVPGSLGIFGGTFDPIHIAHLAVAEAARDALGLDQVLFIPAGRPPHKSGRPITPAEHRLTMVELAIAGNGAFATSRIEIDREGPSYTVDTLEAFAAETADLTLILSAEAFLELPTWREPRRVLDLARLAVAPREGYGEATQAFLDEHFPGAEPRAVFLDGPRLRLSASELRTRAAGGRSLRYLVPDAVADHIGDHALYRPTRRDDGT
jgi:nicotinate-nucleotide adenylyltransferase